MNDAAQFGIHRSPSRSSSRPFVIVLQSDDFDAMRTRIVASPVVQDTFPPIDGEHPRVAPTFMVQGRSYTLNPFDLATLTVGRLGKAVGSLASNDDTKRRIQDSLDAVLKPF